MADVSIRQVTAAASGVVSASGPAVLMSVWGENRDTVTLYFQIFDRATIPTLGVAPSLPSIRVPAGGGFNAELPGPALPLLAGQEPGLGQVFATGISVGWSTTAETYTAAAVGGVWLATARNSA